MRNTRTMIPCGLGASRGRAVNPLRPRARGAGWALALLGGGFVGATGATANAGVITSGGATYTTGNAPSSSNAWGPASDLVGALTSADHLYQDWWWVRLAGASRESTLKGNGAIASSGSDQLVFSTTISGANVSARWALSTPASGQTRLTASLTITNTQSATLSLSVFHYADIDVNGTWSDDVVSAVSPTSLLFRDAASPASSGLSPYQVLYEASGAPTFGVGQSGSLITALTDNNVTNFNSTLPSAASTGNDQAGGWQWTIQLAPGQSTNLVTTMTLIPSPPALGVVGGLGLVALRRRRR